MRGIRACEANGLRGEGLQFTALDLGDRSLQGIGNELCAFRGHVAEGDKPCEADFMLDALQSVMLGSAPQNQQISH
jgi:hypothetical protein